MSLFYTQDFFITKKVSNNVFSFKQRISKKLYVPKLILGTLEDVKTGQEIVFEDFDENGVLHSCFGLNNFVKLYNNTVPIYIFDNHNHSFAFWHYEKKSGQIDNNALLIHIDQHKDMRIPESFLTQEEAKDTEKVFRYTNTVLNVGNFIPAAQKTSLVSDIVFIDSEYSLENFQCSLLQNKDVILDIDLDFFAPELDYIGNDKKLDLIQKLLPLASVITIATSPFFIEQDLALEWLRKIFSVNA